MICRYSVDIFRFFLDVVAVARTKAFHEYGVRDLIRECLVPQIAAHFGTRRVVVLIDGCDACEPEARQPAAEFLHRCLRIFTDIYRFSQAARRRVSLQIFIDIHTY